jgi:hypothetical protein
MPAEATFDLLTLQLLTLQRDGVDQTQWPRLSCSQAHQAALAVGDLRLDDGREIIFQDQGQIRSFDDTHKLVFNRQNNRLELHEIGDISFLTGAPTPTEKMRILATGDVGIGTATPTQPLEVVGTVKATAFQGDGAALTNVRDTTKVAKAGDTMTGPLSITAAGTGLRVTNNASVEGTLTVESNVGIGTLHPTAMLHIDGGGIDNTGSTAVVRIVSQNGNQTLLLDGNEIDATNDGLFLNNNTNQNVILANGGGNVGIGTKSPADRLHVVGDVRANHFHDMSDTRFKTNITVLTNVLENLERIRGVSFEWNELSESLGCTPGRRGIGVIAQDVEAVFPELVTRGGDEEYRAIDYGRLTAVLVEAVKELKAENLVLKQRIEALEMT